MGRLTAALTSGMARPSSAKTLVMSASLCLAQKSSTIPRATDEDPGMERSMTVSYTHLDVYKRQGTDTVNKAKMALDIRSI